MESKVGGPLDSVFEEGLSSAARAGGGTGGAPDAACGVASGLVLGSSPGAGSGLISGYSRFFAGSAGAA